VDHSGAWAAAAELCSVCSRARHRMPVQKGGLAPCNLAAAFRVLMASGSCGRTAPTASALRAPALQGTRCRQQRHPSRRHPTNPSCWGARKAEVQEGHAAKNCDEDRLALADALPLLQAPMPRLRELRVPVLSVGDGELGALARQLGRPLDVVRAQLGLDVEGAEAFVWLVWLACALEGRG
jgi:hypothetical protein